MRYGVLTVSIMALLMFSAAANAADKGVDKVVEKPNVASASAMGEESGAVNVASDAKPPATGGKTYMAQFCAEGGACKTTQKQEVCERFRNSAMNVQQLLDRAIDCDDKIAKGLDADCDGLDAGRIDLLKQYWQDEDMAYTILFLPDMVQNAAASCQAKTATKK